LEGFRGSRGPGGMILRFQKSHESHPPQRAAAASAKFAASISGFASGREMKRKSGSTPGGFRSIQVQQRGLFVLTGKVLSDTDELLGFAKGPSSPEKGCFCGFALKRWNGVIPLIPALAEPFSGRIIRF